MKSYTIWLMQRVPEAKGVQTCLLGRIRLIPVMFALLLLVAGCSQQANPPPVPSSEDATEPAPVPEPAPEYSGEGYGVGNETADGESAWQHLRPFPLPAPRASAEVVIPNRYLLHQAAIPTTLGDVADKLLRALDAAGYSEKAFLPISGGYAVLTRMERINRDGTPKAINRFDVNVSLMESFSLSEYLRALLTANPGYFRILAFVVGPQQITQTGQPVTADELSTWAAGGSDVLPPSVASTPYMTAQGYHCTALIYEFRKEETQERAKLLLPSPQQGRDHLRLSGVWAALTQ